LIYGGAGLLLLPLVLSVPETARPHAETRRESPALVVRELLGDPRLLCLWLGGLVAIACGIGFAAWAPSYFIRERGLGVTEAGLLFGIGALGGGIGGSLLGGTLADRRQRTRAAGGLDVAIVSAILSAPLIFTTINTGSPWVFGTVGLLGLIAIYAIFPALQTVLVTWVPKERHGLASALNVFFLGGLGSALGPFVVGVVSDRLGSLHGALLVPTFGLLVAAALIAGARRLARRP
jgi:MFS family permease